MKSAAPAKKRSENVLHFVEAAVGAAAAPKISAEQFRWLLDFFLFRQFERMLYFTISNQLLSDIQYVYGKKF